MTSRNAIGIIDVDGLLVGEAMVREMRDLIARQDKTIVELSDHQARANDVNRRCLAERDAALRQLADARLATNHVVESLSLERNSLLADVQRESARVNEMSGVIAHLVGVLAEVHRATSIDNAKTFAEIALANIEAWHADAWKPGPSDDAADWKPGHWRKS